MCAVDIVEVYVNIADDHTPGEGRCTFKYVSKIDEKVVIDGKYLAAIPAALALYVQIARPAAAAACLPACH